MAQQNPTVFQKLTKMFGFPGQSKPEQAPSFNFDKNELLKTDKEILVGQLLEYYTRIKILSKPN